MEHDPVQRLDGDLADIVGDGDTEPLPPLEEITEGATLAPATDEDILLRLLQRTNMVELAKQPGQGRREAAQKMREVSDAFGAPQHLRAQSDEISRFGAAEHDKVAALARHRDLLGKARDQHETAPADLKPDWRSEEWQGQEVPQEPDVEILRHRMRDRLRHRAAH